MAHRKAAKSLRKATAAADAKAAADTETLRAAMAAADAETLRAANKASVFLASARLAKKMRQQLRRAERKRARDAVKIYLTQAARRLSRRLPPDKFTKELCAWIDEMVIWYNAKHFYEMPPQPGCWFPPSPPKTRATAPPLPKMSTTCEDEPATEAPTSAPASLTAQVASAEQGEVSELIVSDLDAATAAFFVGVSELGATAAACLPAPAAPVSRPGQTATTTLENCSFATKCTSACCASLAPVPALAPAPMRSAGRRLALDAPIAIIAVSPIAEVVECFMANDMTYLRPLQVCLRALRRRPDALASIRAGF